MLDTTLPLWLQLSTTVRELARPEITGACAVQMQPQGPLGANEGSPNDDLAQQRAWADMAGISVELFLNG